MGIHFNKYAEEGNAFINHLAKNLGHPKETSRTSIILRAVLHAFRDRITIAESFNLLSQLPMFIKAIYVEGWKYREHPVKFNKEEFLEEIKRHQDQLGENEFPWKESTEEIVKTVINELRTFVSKGEIDDILAQLPDDFRELFREK
ncbi:MAG: DUF2267 domain-containing protein [Marinilabiliaceae bacterium]